MQKNQNPFQSYHLLQDYKSKASCLLLLEKAFRESVFDTEPINAALLPLGVCRPIARMGLAEIGLLA